MEKILKELRNIVGNVSLTGLEGIHLLSVKRSK